MFLSRRQLLQTGTAALLTRALRAKSLAVRIGVTDWNLQQEGKLPAVELAKQIGFDGVEISLGVGTDRLPMSDPARQKQYLDESRKWGLPLASTCLEILHRNYLRSDPLARRWVADAIPITKALGAHVILLPSFGKGAFSSRQDLDNVAEYLKPIAPEAEKAGVVLGLENESSAEDNARILDRVGSAAVRVYYDIGNSTQHGFDVVKEIRWLGADRICEFHIKDNPHYLGEGSINVAGVVDAIGDIGFKGWAHLETECPSKSVAADMTRNLRYVRDLFTRRAARS